MAGAKRRARAVRLAIFDVDGVLTDGTLWIGRDGKEDVKAFSILDGHGVKMLQAAGIATAILSGRTSPMVAKRAKDLGIEDVIQGSKDKLAAFTKLCRDRSIAPEACAFMGDDLPDLDVMMRCGFAAAPANAAAAVKVRAHLVTRAFGGRGAVREFCEALLRAQGRADIVSGKHPVK
jgi:3-deoxy-D-manno-octulosonate 8-phosphate phosphatase (KDO 8-P phosphatase)